MLVFTLNLGAAGPINRTQTDSAGLTDSVTPDLQSPPATPDLKFDFNNGTDGVLCDELDTPSAGDTAFTNTVENTASGGSFKYETDAAMHGSLGLRLSTGVTATSCYAEWNTTGSGLSLYSRYYIRIPTGTTFSARWDHWQPRDASTRVRHGLNTSRQLQAVNGSTVVGTMTTALAFDTYYRVESKLIIDASAGIMELKLFVGDSTTATETLTVTALNTGTTECTNVRMGNPFSVASLGPIDFDDFAISYTGYMGPVITGTNYNQTQTDSAGVTDSQSVSFGFGRAQTDSAGVTDTTSTAIGYGRTQTDNANPTDALVTALARARSQDDNAGVTDAVSAALAYARQLDDNSGLTDSITSLVAKTADLTDSAGLTDALSLVFAYARTLDDPAGVSDAVTRALAYSRTLDDSAGLTDAVSGVLGRFIDLTDSAGLTDAVSTALSYARSVTDSTGLTDNVTTSLVSWARSLSDTAGVTDSIAISVGQTVTDDAGLSDVVTFTIAGATYKFTPPSRKLRPHIERPHGLWLRLRQDSAVSVLKFGTSYQQLEDPDPADIEIADAAYLGGRSYLIDGAERNDLVTAGYGAYIVEVT